MFSNANYRSEVRTKSRQRPRSSILVSQLAQLSDEETKENPNLSLAEDLIKYKNLLGELLVNDESISLEELEDCENLNPFRDWFIQVIQHANCLKQSVSDDFLNEIEKMTKDQVKLVDVMQKNEELEQKYQKLNMDLLEFTGH